MRHTTAILLTLLVVPAMLAAQQDTTQRHGTRAQPRLGHADSTHRAARSSRARRYQTSNGSVSLSRGSMGLSSDQIRQLQDALDSDGCSPGPVDGVIGPRTRRAMACARQKLGVSSRDPNALLHALNLDFSVSGKGMGGIERSGAQGRPHAMGRDTTRAHPDSGQMSGSRMSHKMGTMPPRRLRPDSSRRP